MVNFGYPYNDIVICKDSTDYLDIEENLNSTVLKFADDTKVMKVIDNHHCHADLQNDIKGLEKWAKLWQMQFNVDKCKMMHFGFNNTRHTYTMNNKELQTVSEEKDLGVIIQVDGRKCSHFLANYN